MPPLLLELVPPPPLCEPLLPAPPLLELVAPLPLCAPLLPALLLSVPLLLAPPAPAPPLLPPLPTAPLTPFPFTPPPPTPPAGVVPEDGPLEPLLAPAPPLAGPPLPEPLAADPAGLLEPPPHAVTVRSAAHAQGNQYPIILVEWPVDSFMFTKCSGSGAVVTHGALAGGVIHWAALSTVAPQDGVMPSASECRRASAAYSPHSLCASPAKQRR